MEFVPSLFFWQFMVSALLILGVMSLIIGYNSNEKSFLLYTIYTFFLLFYFILITPYDIEWRDQLLASRFKSLRWYTQVIYNCSYFLFFLYFLDVKKHLHAFYIFIRKVVGIAFLAGTSVFVYAMVTNNSSLFDNFYIYVFVPILFLFAIYTLFKACSIPGKLKYFFIMGGGFFIVLAMIALFFPIMGWELFAINPFTFFYIGIFVEQFVFALGLAYKVKEINFTLLQKSIENQQIKEEQNKILEEKLKEKEIENISVMAKAEEERVSRLKSKFENEIHHLHLTSLQSQMNPHFIFNALNSIKVFLIDNEKQKAVYFLNKFSKLIRSILESSNVEKISLEEELSILALYVSIENIRFEEDINFTINNPENIDLQSIWLPSMILQPFVENAIWHGLMLRKGKKYIDLILSQSENAVILLIRDNGIGREESKQNIVRKSFEKKSIGLKLTQDRLNHFNQKYGCNYFFKINDLENEKNLAIGTEIEFVFCFTQP